MKILTLIIVSIFLLVGCEEPNTEINVDIRSTFSLEEEGYDCEQSNLTNFLHQTITAQKEHTAILPGQDSDGYYFRTTLLADGIMIEEFALKLGMTPDSPRQILKGQTRGHFLNGKLVVFDVCANDLVYEINE